MAYELGAESNRGAKFATKVSLLNAIALGVMFSLLVMIVPDKLAMIFTSSSSVTKMVHELSPFLAITILVNGIQSILSGEETSKSINLMIQIEYEHKLRKLNRRT